MRKGKGRAGSNSTGLHDVKELERVAGDIEKGPDMRQTPRERRL